MNDRTRGIASHLGRRCPPPAPFPPPSPPDQGGEQRPPVGPRIPSSSLFEERAVPWTCTPGSLFTAWVGEKQAATLRFKHQELEEAPVTPPTTAPHPTRKE